MILNDSEIEALLGQRSITDQWPWCEGEMAVEKNVKDIVAELRRSLAILERTEYGHYGSGYASFIDCWLYRETPEFRAGEDGHWGLVILFSRLSNFYVFGEGEKSGRPGGGGSSYLPGFPFVDDTRQPAVRSLVERVESILKSRGLVRLRQADLSPTLPPRFSPPTILSEAPWRLFDALFYWED